MIIGHDFTVGQSYPHPLPEGWTENGVRESGLPCRTAGRLTAS